MSPDCWNNGYDCNFFTKTTYEYKWERNAPKFVSLKMRKKYLLWSKGRRWALKCCLGYDLSNSQSCPWNLSRSQFKCECISTTWSEFWGPKSDKSILSWSRFDDPNSNGKWTDFSYRDTIRCARCKSLLDLSCTPKNWTWMRGARTRYIKTRTSPIPTKYHPRCYSSL